MNNFWKGFVVALLIAYVISPRDLLFGPIDDIILTVILYVAIKKRTPIEKHDNEQIEVIDTEGKEIK